ncbi:MAG: preprotein translocase subunit YajC [Candidatus Marinimicrobia bacterium]|nr:preprotein translocase subunit YajC [Candidatus Neomarinimicrobiota bacterium]
MLSILPFVLIMLILYFLMIRPQAKRQKEKRTMLEALKKGDRIVTIGGVHGTVVGLKNQGKIVVIKVDKNTNLTVVKSSIAGLAESVTDKDTRIEA